MFMGSHICEGVVIHSAEPQYFRNGSRVLIKNKNGNGLSVLIKKKNARFAEKKSVVFVKSTFMNQTYILN